MIASSSGALWHVSLLDFSSDAPFVSYYGLKHRRDREKVRAILSDLLEEKKISSSESSHFFTPRVSFWLRYDIAIKKAPFRFRKRKMKTKLRFSAPQTTLFKCLITYLCWPQAVSDN